MPETNSSIPYAEIDTTIVELVRALNEFPATYTIGSCGGHEKPVAGQWEAGTWYVLVGFHQTMMGWRALEYLAWAINSDYQRAEHHVVLKPIAPPPYLNTPGECLRFSLEGYDGENPNELADFLRHVKQWFK